MPQMRTAARTPQLDEFHEERPVGPRDDILGRDRLPEARPSGARVELGIRAEQRRPAADASVEPLRAQFIIIVRERPLRAPLSGHVVLLGGELLSPFSVAFDDLA